jgi:CubicO group peptidase (beta-lactamase class C family)
MTTTLSDRQEEVAARLAELAAEYGVPGAAVAIASGVETITAATGVLSRHTGYPVTTDSWFQIGSITKLFTSSLVMQLADEGAVDPEEPVRRYLTDFSVGDPEADAAITVRNLLTHSSGIQGDYFADFGRGDDAVSRYVASLAEVGSVHRPGEMFSYCNSGFSVLGRLLEVVRGKRFDDILAERLFAPLGISGGTLADQAMLGRAAVGHVEDKAGGPSRPAPIWALPYASGPAGATPFMDPAGLVSFARMHLGGGTSSDGTVVLSAEAVAGMQERRYAAPGQPHRAVGSSWILETWGEETVIGHTGGTLGQYAFFRVHPASGTITVLLTNGPGAMRLNRGLIEPLLTELTGAPAPELPVPPADPPELDLDAAIGRYRHHGMLVTVERSGAALRMSTIPEDTGALAGFAEPEVHDLIPLRVADGVESYLTADQTEGVHLPVAFLTAGGGPAHHLHSGGRAFARVVGPDDGVATASAAATM